MANETTPTETVVTEDADAAFDAAWASIGTIFEDEPSDNEEQETATETAPAETAAETTDTSTAEETVETETATVTEGKSEQTTVVTHTAEDTQEVDALRAELDKAREELAKMRRREQDISEHLKSEGYDSIDAELAERMGMSIEDYQKHISTESDAELAEKYRTLMAQEAEKKKQNAANDLFRRDEQAILEYDPQLKGRFSKLEQAPFFKDFAILRSMGKSVIDAYRMANFAELSAREAKKTEPAPDNRGHITSSATKKVGAEVTSIPAEEIAIARELFPDLSDAEIDRLYKRVN